MSKHIPHWLVAGAVVLGLSTATAGAASSPSLQAAKRNPAAGAFARTTRLVGKLKAPTFMATNNGVGAAFAFGTVGTTVGRFSVARGGDRARPFTTNATGVATGLNADRVDGFSAAAFLLADAKAVDAGRLDGLDSSSFLRSGGTAADAEKLDGLDSAEFLRRSDGASFLSATGKAVNADQLDAYDSSDFVRKTETSGFLTTSSKAADADKLDGLDSSSFLGSERIVSLSGDTHFNQAEPRTTMGSGGGLTFRADCVDVAGDDTVEVYVSVSSGTALFSITDTIVGADQTTVGAAEVRVLEAEEGDMTTGNMVPVPFVVLKSDGTAFQGILALAANFQGFDCFAAGTMMR